MEAVSNSLYSVTDRLGSKTSADGRISISVIRQDASHGRGIVGFDVEDNGQGFTKALLHKSA